MVASTSVWWDTRLRPFPLQWQHSSGENPLQRNKFVITATRLIHHRTTQHQELDIHVFKGSDFNCSLKKKKIFVVVHHTHATNIEDLCDKNILIPFLAFFFSHKLVSQKSNLVTLLVPDILHGRLGGG